MPDMMKGLQMQSLLVTGIAGGTTALVAAVSQQSVYVVACDVSGETAAGGDIIDFIDTTPAQISPRYVVENTTPAGALLSLRTGTSMDYLFKTASGQGLSAKVGTGGAAVDLMIWFYQF